MFKTVQINTKTGKTLQVRNAGKLVRFDDLAKADRFAVRLTMAESNPDLTYMTLNA